MKKQLYHAKQRYAEEIAKNRELYLELTNAKTHAINTLELEQPEPSDSNKNFFWMRAVNWALISKREHVS